MNVRTSLHYLLALCVLFASSFTTFHSSEHLEGGHGFHNDSHYGAYVSHAEHRHHHDQSSHSGDHSIDPLCEVCLTLSSLSDFPVNKLVLTFVSGLYVEDSELPSIVRLSSSGLYLSRAPPTKV